MSEILPFSLHDCCVSNADSSLIIGLRLDQGLSSDQAWRVAFIVPFILIVSTAAGMWLFCDDTPTGKWSERHIAAEQLRQQIVQIPGTVPSDSSLPGSDNSKHDVKGEKLDMEAHVAAPDVQTGQTLDAAKEEVILAPTLQNTLRILRSPQTLFHCATYACSFGGELAINSYLGAYYQRNFPSLGQTNAGRWAAMFGLLNVVTRPLGGIVADILYKYTHSLWIKKLWIVFVGVVSGAFLIAIGLTDPGSQGMMFGLIAGMAVFLEAGNGANFALVPHVHPHASGVLSGTIGAVGNLGGVVYAIVFRYHGTDYAESFWIIGIMVIGLNLILCWVHPVPRSQRVAGR